MFQFASKVMSNDVDYLKRVLAKEERENRALQEECAVLMNLVVRKYYKNITELQFCTTLRKKNLYYRP